MPLNIYSEYRYIMCSLYMSHFLGLNYSCCLENGVVIGDNLP